MAAGCHGDLLLFRLALFAHSSAHAGEHGPGVMERERGMRWRREQIVRRREAPVAGATSVALRSSSVDAASLKLR